MAGEQCSNCHYYRPIYNERWCSHKDHHRPLKGPGKSASIRRCGEWTPWYAISKQKAPRIPVELTIAMIDALRA